MNIVFFSHPSFVVSQSMPRYAQWLASGMKERGHDITIWKPQPRFYNRPVPQALKKWLGYVDQFIVFPEFVKKQLKNLPASTLFVFTDHALGAWVPLVHDRPHIIHCHDFLAQQSAAGEIPENHVSWTGRQYQALIRRGYRKGKNFISVSYKTKEDLHSFLDHQPERSEVVYNGLTQAYTTQNKIEARRTMSEFARLSLSEGYLLHVGGNHWYKNRSGCIKIYNAWRQMGGKLPLLLIGEAPDEQLLLIQQESSFKQDIYFLTGVCDSLLNAAYSGASVFLFPSLAEGFGWPIAEAMACGCPVITTNEAPMSEVAAGAAWLVPRMPVNNKKEQHTWAINAAIQINEILGRTVSEQQFSESLGLKNIERFDSQSALNKIEEIYLRIA